MSERDDAAWPTVGLVYDPALAGYRFSPSHPMQPVRVTLTLDLAAQVGLLDDSRLVRLHPGMATDAELELVHAPEYVRAVRAFSADPEAIWGTRHAEAARFGLSNADNTAFAGMHDAAALVAGSTLCATRAVLDGTVQRAFSIAGGLHHAHRAQASGFCVYNDLAVAIADARQRQPDCRVAYIDVDAHHGDGVQGLFYSDPNVLTISLHESGRHLFPGTGFIQELGDGPGYGRSINVPLDPFVSDAVFLDAFERVVPPLVRAFQPDLIVMQAGCDSHFLDPLTHLATTTAIWEPLMVRIGELAADLCQGRWVVTGGGGYAIYEVVPRVWTIILAALLGVSLADELPTAWMAQVRDMTGEEIPSTFSDYVALDIPPHRAQEIAQSTDRTVQRLQNLAFPLFGLTGTISG